MSLSKRRKGNGSLPNGFGSVGLFIRANPDPSSRDTYREFVDSMRRFVALTNRLHHLLNYRQYTYIPEIIETAALVLAWASATSKRLVLLERPVSGKFRDTLSKRLTSSRDTVREVMKYSNEASVSAEWMFYTSIHQPSLTEWTEAERFAKRSEEIASHVEAHRADESSMYVAREVMTSAGYAGRAVSSLGYLRIGKDISERSSLIASLLF